MARKPGRRGPRVAVAVKQIPRFEAMALSPEGRLVRDGVELEMNPYCRRAVAKGVEIARETGGECTVFTLGPDFAEDVLREAIAWGAEAGVLVSDPAFAGSDTLATARALAVALGREGPFDLILFGRNSVDADTGQVGPQVAELLDLPFVCSVRELALDGETLHLRGELDDGWLRATVALPAVLSVAERLCAPAKADPAARQAVPADRIRRLSAGDLGPGPWGQAGSPTKVGAVRVLEFGREARVLAGALHDQAREAVALLAARGALEDAAVGVAAPGVPEPTGATDGPVVAAILEPDRERLGGELLGAAAGLAQEIGGRVAALAPFPLESRAMGAAGAGAAVVFEGARLEEDMARAVADWAAGDPPWAILAPSTTWGREVAARIAARLGAGLTGDAAELEVRDERLIAWKPAFGGAAAAAITASSPVQMATVRAGALPLLAPRRADAPVTVVRVRPRGRVTVLERTRDDELGALATAERIVGVGMGVSPEAYERLRPLTRLLGAELAATRKVTDQGWLPRARQVGITGQSVAPRLYVAIGLSGKFNHTIGLRRAGTVVAINTDPAAPIFEAADIGIVGDWREAVDRLVEALGSIARTVPIRHRRARGRRPGSRAAAGPRSRRPGPGPRPRR